jgi:hypothetical protein
MANLRIENINQAIATRLLPTITLWNRLEGRPRTDNFDRALKAEIRDPLWMLARQWQIGEFEGDDAGSPVFAKIHLATNFLNAYQPHNQPPQPFDGSTPLEAQVEQRPLPFTRGQQIISLDIRLLMGRQWLKLMRSIGNFKQEFIDQYLIDIPDPTTSDDAEICSNVETWQQVAAVAERAMDGYKLYRYLLDAPTNHAYDGTSIPAGQHTDVDALAVKFLTWYKNLFFQPQEPEQNAWQPEYLEYKFAVAAPDGGSNSVFVADEYYHGRLDWYNLDVDNQRNDLGEIVAPAPKALENPTKTFIPTPLDFEGMPNTRWWTFEDSRTNFGNVNPGTTDLAKLMLIEFGLVYANDWFLFPVTLPTGTVTRVRGLAVTNVFGEKTWVKAAGRGRDEDWQRWNMYTMAVRSDADVGADMRFVLLPTVPKIQEGKPLEDVVLIRDEMANMVWGIEAQVAMPDGHSISGYEAGDDLRKYLVRLVGSVPGDTPAAAAPIRYKIMSTNIAENWIPFIPVHMPGETEEHREIQLQRAALPRIIPGDSASISKVLPRTTILREGLDAGSRYFVHEEEIGRAGVDVRQSYQRTRWYNGRVVVWLGIRKATGRGEGRSNLSFDQLVPVPFTAT